MNAPYLFHRIEDLESRPADAPELSPECLELINRMLSAFREHVLTDLNQPPAVATAAADFVKAYIRHSGQPPRHWNKTSFAAWASSLDSDSNDAPKEGGQAEYIRCFTDYLVSPEGFSWIVRMIIHEKTVRHIRSCPQAWCRS